MSHYRCYVPRKFSEDNLALIDAANKIIEEYEKAGYALTLRQLYYQFVARGLLENLDRNYDRLGSVVSDGRLAGLISWTAIEDRTRHLRGERTYNGPAELLKEAREQYTTDKWEGQQWRPEVWVEKDALLGVIEPVCLDLGINYFACRGYNSQSEQWRAGQRFANYIGKGQRPLVLHLGDHDPSGIDMTRDNIERLSLFAGTPITVARLALNYPQVQKYNPPPNPTKLSDSRAASYVEKYGYECWELDALDPKVLGSVIRDAVLKVRNEELWNEALLRETEEKRWLDEVLEEMKGKP